MDRAEIARRVRGIQNLGERRQVMTGRDTAQCPDVREGGLECLGNGGAAALIHRVEGVRRVRGLLCENGARSLRRHRRASGWGGHSCARRIGPGRRPGESPGLLVRTPDPQIVEENLEIVHGGDERGCERRRPFRGRRRGVSGRPARRGARSAMPVSLWTIAAPRSVRAYRTNSVASGPLGPGARQHVVQMFETLAGLEDEELQRIVRRRHSCPAGRRVTRMGRRRGAPRASALRACCAPSRIM